jgi:Putative Flp pilus-assembly TadE/G-like
MRKRARFATHSGEHGQTIVLVVLTIVTLLAMAALAIDVVTLYVAKGEVQRAADAAALVAAKAFVDSGVTSEPTNTSLQTLAQNMGTAGVNGILQQNKVAGIAPAVVGTPNFDFTSNPGNPQVTVTLTRTGLPIFFARIWRTAAATVTASAKAEAYNPSNSQTATGNYIPIAPKCVKPLLIPNKDPNNPGAPFILPTGVVSAGVVGKQIILKDACQAGNPNAACTAPLPLDPPANGGQAHFVPALVTPNTSNLCPSCQGSSNFEQSIECCDFNAYHCGGTVPNGAADTVITTKQVDNETKDGAACLINKPSQDQLDPGSNFPTGPQQFIAGSGPLSGQLVSTSHSIASFPIINTPVPATGQVTVVGFLQGFIQAVTGGLGNLQITITVLNLAGCGNNPGTGAPITAGSVSPIPVRLIHE